MDLICFDLDNTLVHSDKAHVKAYNYALSRLGLKKKNPKLIEELLGRPHNEVEKLLAPNLTEKQKVILRKYKYNYLKTKGYSDISAIKGVKPALKKLKKCYNLAVLSNCPHKDILLILKSSKIKKDLFKIIIGNDDVKKSKPDPDEILKAQKLMHHKADYMVGDTIYDIIAAKKANVKAISVLTGTTKKEKLKKYKPYKILKSINELPKLLKK